MGFQVQGLREMRDALKKLRDEGGDAVDEGLKEYLELDVYPATQILVPKLTGELAASGRVEKLDDEPHAYALWYGIDATEGPDVDYAAAVEVRDDTTHAPPTQAHYVEEPLKADTERAARRVADRFEKILGG